MASSGYVNTSAYQGRYYTLYWDATPNIANNTSTISWSLYAYGGSSSWYAERELYVTIAGSTVYSKSARVQRYTGYITSGTKVINHNSVGAASFSASVQAAVYVSSINCTGSGSFTLDTIPRKSTLSVGNGVLGTEQTITVTRQASSFTHTITYTCGSASGTICTKSSSTSIKFTPPMNLASQNTTGTSVSIKYTITTYSGSTDIGANSYTKTCTMPDSIKPSVVTSVLEATDLQWRVFVQDLSKLKVNATATTSYGAAITSYKTTVAGKSYNGSSFTTDLITSSGRLAVVTTVTDERGRTGTYTNTIEVIEYKSPYFTSLKVNRCDENGIENLQGEYCKIAFDCTCSGLNGNNEAVFKIEYKKTSDSEYILYDTIGYGIIDGNTGVLESIIPADTNNSYHIRVTANDAFKTMSQITVLSTGFSIIHFLASGLGIAFGKIAELTNVFDIGFQTRFMGGILQPVLEVGTDFDTLKIPNTYTLKSVNNSSYVNCPLVSGTGVLKIESCGEEGQIRQAVSVCNKSYPLTYERYYYQNSWGEWLVTSAYEVTLYHQSGGTNGTVTLSSGISNFRYLEIYYTDNNKSTKSYMKYFVGSGTITDLSLIEASDTSNTFIRRTRYSISGNTITPNLDTACYVKIASSGITINGAGVNYIYIYRVVGIK